MSLPSRVAFKFRGNKLLLILAALLVAVPGVAVAALTRGLDFDAFNAGTQEPSAQEPSKEYQAGKEAGAAEARRREERERETAGVAERGPNFKAELAERDRHVSIQPV